MKTNRRAKSGLGKALGIGLVAGLTAFGAGKARAEPTVSINTIINDSEDMDLNRAGTQIRYDWAVQNTTPNSDWEEDSMWDYAIQTNLENKGMYGFTNSGPAWDYVNGAESSFEVGSGTLLRPGGLKTFSAYIDSNLVTGNEWVGSYTTCNNGQSNVVDIQVPVPEPAVVGLLGVGALTALGLKRYGKKK